MRPMERSRLPRRNCSPFPTGMTCSMAVTRSVFVDGAPSGSRQLRDGRSIDLADATSQANGEPRPWGANNPRWQLFAYGPLGGAYVIVWAGDDPAETDGDPGRDDVLGNPGAGYRGASRRGVRRRQGAYCSRSHGAPDYPGVGCHDARNVVMAAHPLGSRR